MRRLAVATALAAASLALPFAPLAHASTPDHGTVDATATTASWAGPSKPAADTGGPDSDSCTSAGSFCDDYTLNVPVDPAYWTTHGGGVRVSITWTNDQNDFDLYVYDANGVEVGESAGGPPSVKESTVVLHPSGSYDVRVVYYQVVNDAYSGTAEWAPGPLPPAPRVASFDTTHTLAFAAPTTVSPVAFGAEPQQTIERPVAQSLPGAVDPNRIFVDWPFDGLQTSMLNRSTDGGDSFRALVDPVCAARGRPNCGSLGGGDSEEDVNRVDGTLLFADQQSLTPAGPYESQEAVVSSTDHGDSFPAARQHAIDNLSALSEDRQWLAATSRTDISVNGSKIVGFLSYHTPDQWIHGIDDAGNLQSPSAAQIPGVWQSGSLRVDATDGPGAGWLYQAYWNGSGVHVATVKATNYLNPVDSANGWTVHDVSPDNAPSVFPWLNLDNHGNAYTVWVDKGAMYYAASPVDDPRNDPAQGGTPGSYWTPQVRVSLPSVGSAVFPTVTAGDPGRVGIAYMGTTAYDDGRGNTTGMSDNAVNTVPWNTYAAVITNALSDDPASPPVVTTGVVSHRVVHYGPICTGGISCTSDNRSLLDMIDVNYDQSGRLGVVYMDNNSAEQMPDGAAGVTRYAPFVQYAKQVHGPSVLAAGNPIALTPPNGSATDAAGDATWPNTASGTNLPGLDLTSASLTVNPDGTITAQMTLKDASAAAMQQALVGYNTAVTSDLRATRLQYVMRFADAANVYHLSAAYDVHTQQVTFFGGKLTGDDGSAYLVPQVLVPFGTDYTDHKVAGLTGSVQGNTLTITAPAASLGIDPAQPLIGATGFALAGQVTNTGYSQPSKDSPSTPPSTSSTSTPMRVVDATPPFDVQQGPGSVVPEAPVTVLLPLAGIAVAVGGSVLVAQRRRRQNRG